MLDNLRIILVEPMYSGNLGSVARAMENAGLSDLVLVRPECTVDRHARAMAANAGKTLNAARIVKTLDEALEDCVWAVGFTASSDKRPKDRHIYREVIPQVLQTISTRKIGLVFGREDSGLDNQAIDRCRYLCSLTTHPQYESLNLAQAVLLSTNALYAASLEAPPVAPAADEASHQERESLYAAMQEALVHVGFIDSPEILPHTMRHLRRILEKARLISNEVAVLRGICRQIRWAKDQEKF